VPLAYSSKEPRAKAHEIFALFRGLKAAATPEKQQQEQRQKQQQIPCGNDNQKNKSKNKSKLSTNY
jgi:hypothetical protein